jgi:hypothetical protein
LVSAIGIRFYTMNSSRTHSASGWITLSISYCHITKTSCNLK